MMRVQGRQSRPRATLEEYMAFSRKYSSRMAVATAMAVVSLATPLAFAQQADATGEVRRVDAAAGKVSIKHDAISALDLPAMTLVYQIDPALLAGIKPGDKVRFTATRKDGRYVVTAISK
ncbi:copper binding periplasmic protein CusF [Bordetella bronchiseptica CA90 BB1334]|nr:copper binding periplasmic protein CusF [Bordetella bronchiseptica OSU054]KCV40617.1 copper binding periplasmic protein CusF [Bordetella bronchiseptica 345]KCV49220.1 copper binding periplasmic protein CusF [Bordetella bronchiseptica 3E44]KDB78701.1 copper binding periplasmic protein CusF [Bordetella bronchiseptica CA90 BB1334]KDC75002.1 copper binding periplasmic protein CusF [Bordetella bronchiseptica MBORD635]KDD10855.1 copper binding periplasmic protein CusF [Bordetella bronchiseptica M